MTKTERVKAALSGDKVDRTPISFWRHFHDRDRDPDAFAKVMLEFQKEYDLDFMKVMPSGLYSVEDFGCGIRHFDNEHDAPVITQLAIRSESDWEKLAPIPPDKGSLGKQLKALEKIRDGLAGEVPFIQTIFSPLTTAWKLAGDGIFTDIARCHDLVHHGLEVITQTTADFVEACCKIGVTGFFYATKCASHQVMSEREHDEFSRPYDLQVLERIGKEQWFNLLHVHGKHIMFDHVADYPVQAINWHDRGTSPSLKDALECFKGGLVGGINEEKTITAGPPDAIKKEIRDAIEQTDGKHLIIGPGCALATTTPAEHLRAAREAVEE